MISVLHWTRGVVRSGADSHRTEVKGVWIPKGNGK